MITKASVKVQILPTQTNKPSQPAFPYDKNKDILHKILDRQNKHHQQVRYKYPSLAKDLTLELYYDTIYARLTYERQILMPTFDSYTSAYQDPFQAAYQNQHRFSAYSDEASPMGLRPQAQSSGVYQNSGFQSFMLRRNNKSSSTQSKRASASQVAELRPIKKFVQGKQHSMVVNEAFR